MLGFYHPGHFGHQDQMSVVCVYVCVVGYSEHYGTSTMLLYNSDTPQFVEEDDDVVHDGKRSESSWTDFDVFGLLI